VVSQNVIPLYYQQITLPFATMPTLSIKSIFGRDQSHWDGVPKINIYLLRLMFLLMIVFLGRQSWTHIFTFKGPWVPADAMNWCIWAAFATFAILGIINPLKMLPIVMLEVFYKVLWLLLVAYPLWHTNRLAGSSAEGMTDAFLWVVLPILATPWGYVFRRYILNKNS
jgi:hypothetical protein